MELYVIRDIEAFHALREEWNILLDKSESRCLFLRWEWLYNWWMEYGREDERLQILVVRDNGKMTGIAPLYKRTKYLNTLREIAFLGSNVVCSDYLDFILMKGSERETLATMLRHLKEDVVGWDAINLTDMPSASGTAALLESFFGMGSVQVDGAFTECPYMDLDGGWDAVSQMVSPSRRTNIIRKVRKFQNFPGAEFFEVEAKEDLDRYFDEFVRLNKIRMKTKNQSSPFSRDEFIRFHRRILRDLFDAGMVKLCFLRIKDQLVGGIYLFVFKERYYYYQSGFDPAWSKISPGTLMFHFCILNAVERGGREFDFLQGGEAYKYTWTQTKRLNTRVVVYNKTAKGKMARISSKVFLGARSYLRRTLARMGGRG